jgi:transcription initiation factor TFIID subunit TAF12
MAAMPGTSYQETQQSSPSTYEPQQRQQQQQQQQRQQQQQQQQQQCGVHEDEQPEDGERGAPADGMYEPEEYASLQVRNLCATHSCRV